MTEFSTWIAHKMHSRRLAQSDLARAIGGRASTVNGWFTRDAIPGASTCVELARFFQVPLLDVLAAAGYVPAVNNTHRPPRQLEERVTCLASRTSDEGLELLGDLAAVIQRRCATNDSATLDRHS